EGETSRFGDVRGSVAGPQMDLRGLVEVLAVAGVVAVPEVEVAGGVRPALDVEHDDALVAVEGAARRAGDVGRLVLLFEERLELRHAVGVALAVTAARGGEAAPPVGDRLDGLVDRVAHPDDAGLGHPRHVDRAPDLALDLF